MTIKFWIQHKWDSLVFYSEKAVLTSRVAVRGGTWPFLGSASGVGVLPHLLFVNTKAGRFHDGGGSRKLCLFMVLLCLNISLPFSESYFNNYTFFRNHLVSRLNTKLIVLRRNYPSCCLSEQNF